MLISSQGQNMYHKVKTFWYIFVETFCPHNVKKLKDYLISRGMSILKNH